MAGYVKEARGWAENVEHYAQYGRRGSALHQAEFALGQINEALRKAASRGKHDEVAQIQVIIRNLMPRMEEARLRDQA